MLLALSGVVRIVMAAPSVIGQQSKSERGGTIGLAFITSSMVTSFWNCAFGLVAAARLAFTEIAARCSFFSSIVFHVIFRCHGKEWPGKSHPVRCIPIMVDGGHFTIVKPPTSAGCKVSRRRLRRRHRQFPILQALLPR